DQDALSRANPAVNEQLTQADALEHDLLGARGEMHPSDADGGDVRGYMIDHAVPLFVEPEKNLRAHLHLGRIAIGEQPALRVRSRVEDAVAAETLLYPRDRARRGLSRGQRLEPPTRFSLGSLQIGG